MEARVTRVILDDDGTVYTQHPWVMGMLFIVLGLALVPRVPEIWQIPLGAALAIAGSVIVVRTILKRHRLPRGREMYCHSCYHFWWEKDPVKKTSN
ncbi:MAG: hypothetical protein EHM70_21325 [Chloroflexota bacterium]|nr:MAG: hypothetical protein EHM70_21325 [Chloroflexota bacterium]